MITRAAWLLSLSFCLPCPLPAQQGAAPPAAPLPLLDQGATETLMHAYGEAETWSLRGLVLMSLGPRWHPAGVAIVLDALQHKDPQLRVLGLEALRRVQVSHLPVLAQPELVDLLIEKFAGHKNQLVRARSLEVLHWMVPAAGARDAAAWRQWWRQNRATHAPAPWSEPPQERSSHTVVGQVMERAFDLRDAGLQICIVIDSTGSMQVAIDTACAAVDDIVTLLAGIAPKLELGLVHYKDFEDFGDGAKMICALDKDHRRVRERLGRLTANGGGDMPERVEMGLAVAFGKEMNWDRDKNRLVLVVGDAPAHDDAVAGMLEMVKRAHDEPFATGKGPLTGTPKQTTRPFVTSCIATNEAARACFEQIAKAGGGTAAVLPVAGDRDAAVRRVVAHVLLLSFGPRYETQVRALVETWFEYRAAGMY